MLTIKGTLCHKFLKHPETYTHETLTSAKSGNAISVLFPITAPDLWTDITLLTKAFLDITDVTHSLYLSIEGLSGALWV